VPDRGFRVADHHPGVAVTSLVHVDIDHARNLARQVADQASPPNSTIRPRALHDCHHDLPGLNHVVAIIDSEAARADRP